jgi:enterochelin esterase family protein
MGGFHAMQISKRYPTMFYYVGLFSAAIFRGKEGIDIYEAMEERLKQQFAKGLSLYWIGIGRDDFLYQENVQYRELLDNLALPYIYHESDGGHTWRNWRWYLTEFSQMIFK